MGYLCSALPTEPTELSRQLGAGQFQRNEKYVFFVKYKFNISLLHLQRLQTKHTFLMILMEFLSFQHTRPHKVYWQLQNQAGFY